MSANGGETELATDDADDKSTTPRDDGEETAEEKKRAEDLSDDEEIVEQLLDIYGEVESGYDAQDERYNRNTEFWDLYNCKLGPNQFYSGNSKIFVPIIRNAVNARKTRFVNQLFPTSRRHVEATATDGTSVSALVALLENYIRKSYLRTQVIPSLIRYGDVEGQYNIYVSWLETKRNVTWKTSKPLNIPDVEDPEEDTGDGTTEPADTIEDPDETVEDMDEEEITAAHPSVEVLPDADVLVLPFTADSIPEALRDGGSVTILRRWREGTIKRMSREGHIKKDAADRLLGMLEDCDEDSSKRDTAKLQVNAAGVRVDERGPYCVVYENWSLLYKSDWDDGEEPRVCRSYMCGAEEEDILGCKRNPLWSDRLPIMSAPVEKVAGSFKGKSQLEPVELIQYQANDAINEAMDSAAYALLPIIMTDPEKNPRVGSMILSLAAVWETSPKDTQFAKFPDLWKDGFTIVGQCKSEIFETLSVSPARITQQASTKKLTQAEIANEQQVDLLNTSDAVTTLEDEILTPLMTMFIELDHQFRDKDITVRQYGEMGLRANMQAIPPIQFDRRYTFTWLGVESSRNAQMVQQQIGALNVVRTIPPEQYQGYKLNLAPAISQLMESVFGPVMAPLIFEDVRSQLSMDPEMENELLRSIDMPVHPLDNHDQHLMAHIQELQTLTQEQGPDADAHGNFRTHILKHQAAKAMAAQAQQAALMPPGMGGPPQGPGAGGGAGPRPGASPAPQRPAQAPPGAVRQDAMADPQRMPSNLPPAGVR